MMELTDLDFHFKDLFENTNDLMHLESLDGIVELTNPCWIKTLKYSAEEVSGRSVYDFISPKCVNEYKAKQQTAIESRSFEDIKTTFISKEGEEINLKGQIVCTSKNGDAPCICAVFKNVTTQHKTEKQLNATEGRLQAFFNHAHNAIVIINQDDTILDWNPKAKIIFGFDADEVIGKTLTETIIPERYRRILASEMERFSVQSINPFGNKELKITALKKGGGELLVSVSLSSVKVDNERMFIFFISDISESTKLQEELVRKDTELIHTKRLDEKKDEFLSIASHELKTPLTTVKAYTQIGLSVAEKNNMPLLAEYLKKADRHIDKLTYLINELLDVSKIQAGKLELSFNSVQFDEYLNDIIGSLKHITPQRLEFAGCPTGYVNMDKVRLEQVLTNIVSNASKYSPGQDKIDIRCECVNEQVVVSVQDYGIGIAEDKLDKIFGRFYRVDEIATGFSGLGIGLYIAKEIIRRHGGSIWGESVPGQGSIFKFSLPLINPQEAI